MSRSRVACHVLAQGIGAVKKLRQVVDRIEPREKN